MPAPKRGPRPFLTSSRIRRNVYVTGRKAARWPRPISPGQSCRGAWKRLSSWWSVSARSTSRLSPLPIVVGGEVIDGKGVENDGKHRADERDGFLERDAF